MSATPVNIFVYGTLRDWYGLGGCYFTKDEHDGKRRATMPGRLYTLGGFPVMVAERGGDNWVAAQTDGYGVNLRDPDGQVVGEVITVRPPFRDLRSLITMECSAGYYLDSRLARLANGDLVRCLVFLYEPEDVRADWPRLPGDDFHRQDELPRAMLPNHGRVRSATDNLRPYGG